MDVVAPKESGLAARKIFVAAFSFFLFLTFAAQEISAQTASKEYQIKAAFLFNFAQFVQWPAEVFTNSAEPFRIGVLGDDPFNGALQADIQGENIQGHGMVVVRSRHVAEIEHCQIVFISKSERGRMGEILARLKGRKILTVSEVPGFANRGGMINFYTEGNKVRFEINAAAAQREGLRISSQLMKLGRIVESEISSEGS